MSLSRLLSILGVVFVSAFLGVLAYESIPVGAPRTDTSTPSLSVESRATSTVSVQSSAPTASTTPAPVSKTPASASTPTPKAATSAPAKTPAVTSAPQAPAPTTVTVPSASTTNAELATASASLRSALVNILCYAPVGSTLHSISGSGVFINPKGIILTNAHVAQYFLLANKGVSCEIRSGGPAKDQYRAALIYISPSWIQANATVLEQSQPTGTGQYDFALLAVTKSATNVPLPAQFPYVPLAYTPVHTGLPVVIASYAAQFLKTSEIEQSLFPTIVFGNVKGIFTFAKTTIDAFTLGGSAAAQEGSSGGGVANASGALVGTITTSSITGSTADRSLNGITASYIRAEYVRETGFSLDTLLAESTTTAIASFASRISSLEAILLAATSSS